MRQDKGIIVRFVEGERTLLESTTWGYPPYRIGDEVTVLTGYRRGLKERNLPAKRYRILSLDHLARRVEQPHEVVYWEFCLRVGVEEV